MCKELSTEVTHRAQPQTGPVKYIILSTVKSIEIDHIGKSLWKIERSEANIVGWWKI